MTSGQKGVFNEINITPLTDIFLVLLIIMMVVAPLLDYRGLNVALLSGAPSSDSKDSSEERIRVTIDAQGAYRVGDQLVSSEQLVNAIQREAKENSNGIVIAVHPDSNLEAMAHALDAARVTDITNVSLVEEAANAQKRP